MSDTAVTRVEKPWGYELHWAKTDRYVGKILHVMAGQALSLRDLIGGHAAFHNVSARCGPISNFTRWKPGCCKIVPHMRLNIILGHAPADFVQNAQN